MHGSAAATNKAQSAICADSATPNLTHTPDLDSMNNGMQVSLVTGHEYTSSGTGGMPSDIHRQRTDPLQRSFLGLLDSRPTLYLLSNCYPGKMWSDTESMELANEKDIANIQNWASVGIPDILAYTNNKATIKVMRRILGRLCGQGPTILTIGGHTTPIQGKDTYITADCCKEGQQTPSRGLSFQDMRDLVVSNPKTGPLLITTDACGFTNFLSGANGYWEKTQYYSPDGWDKDQCVASSMVNVWNPKLHMASTAPEEKSFEFRSRGGIFTSVFCGVPLAEELTLGERFTRIRLEVNQFLSEYSSMKGIVPPLTQQPYIYSSCEFDLNDKRLLQNLGFC
ncbi:hypothetical protein FRC06_011409 [Ceratobasidium sp. 370]|nr:hypothetical protein FRC06_011409 [Ceratobasidium sp. 370]